MSPRPVNLDDALAIELRTGVPGRFSVECDACGLKLPPVEGAVAAMLLRAEHEERSPGCSPRKITAATVPWTTSSGRRGEWGAAW